MIRTPEEHLEHLGLIKREAKTKIAAATEKTVTSGYGVRLLPDDEDRRLRKDARRTRSILGKLTLNLPCFGLWMPRAYWDLFQQAADEVQAEWATVSFVPLITRSNQLRGVTSAGADEAVNAHTRGSARVVDMEQKVDLASLKGIASSTMTISMISGRSS